MQCSLCLKVIRLFWVLTLIFFFFLLYFSISYHQRWRVSGTGLGVSWNRLRIVDTTYFICIKAIFFHRHPQTSLENRKLVRTNLFQLSTGVDPIEPTVRFKLEPVLSLELLHPCIFDSFVQRGQRGPTLHVGLWTSTRKERLEALHNKELFTLGVPCKLIKRWWRRTADGGQGLEAQSLQASDWPNLASTYR
jgi:hypothetical protein